MRERHRQGAAIPHVACNMHVMTFNGAATWCFQGSPILIVLCLGNCLATKLATVRCLCGLALLARCCAASSAFLVCVLYGTLGIERLKALVHSWIRLSCDGGKNFFEGFRMAVRTRRTAQPPICNPTASSSALPGKNDDQEPRFERPHLARGFQLPNRPLTAARSRGERFFLLLVLVDLNDFVNEAIFQCVLRRPESQETNTTSKRHK